MDANGTVIRHPDELLGLSAMPLRRARGTRRVAIADESLDRETRERWAAQLNAQLSACGCPEGAVGMIAGIAAYAIVVAIAQPDFFAWAYVGLGILAAVAASGIGKLIGLRGAERRLHTTVAAIRAQWRAPTRAERAAIPCG